MMAEECSLPQDVSTAELRTKRENDVAPHPFATWVGDGVRMNAFGHEDADVAFDPLSAINVFLAPPTWRCWVRWCLRDRLESRST